MDDGNTSINNSRLHFNYFTDTTKYYLLTNGTGYPLADYDFFNMPALKQNSFVIPENHTGSTRMD